MTTDVSYLNNVWAMRYFWLNLALADLRAKYRRSALGIVWALIQPFSLTLLFTFVMGSFFKVPMESYALFIFSGLIFWEFIVSCIMTGCAAFVNAEAYIRQCTHPLLIYTLRNVIACMINLSIAFFGLAIWVLLWRRESLGLEWLILIPTFPLLFFFVWPLATISAFIGARFRDFPQLITIVLQVLYYVSAILFQPIMYKNAHIEYLIQYNPIYHLLNLFRKPVLDAQLPSWDDYFYVLITGMLLWICVWLFVKYQEKKIIFYL